MRRDTFDWRAGDTATWSLGDADGAVRLARTVGSVGIDIETAGLGAAAWRVKALAIGDRNHGIVLDPDNRRHRAAYRQAIAEADEIVVHNSGFDIPILVALGFMRRRDIDKVTDTLLMARLARPDDRGGHSLAECCALYLGEAYRAWKSSLETAYRAVTGKPRREMFAELGLTSPAYCSYACFDTIMAARLREVLPQRIVDRFTDGPLARYAGDPVAIYQRERDVNRLMLHRSARGLQVDLDLIDTLKAEMRREVLTADAGLRRWGVAVDSSVDKIKASAVARLDDLGMLSPRHPRLQNGAPTARATVLDKIGHPIVDLLKARSQADRFVRDYANKVVELSAVDGRLHPQVGVLAAVTGRTAYGSPPLQQFPPRTRRMVVFDRPAVSLDWSAIEPITLALLARETGMIDTYEAGGDLYQYVASAAGVIRPTAKKVFLGSLYGLGVLGLAGQLGVPSAEAEEIRKKVFAPIPAVETARRMLNGMARTYGNVVTVSGRPIPTFSAYAGTNYAVQGSAYDLLAVVLAELYRRGMADEIYLAVHDEIVASREVAAEVDRLMRTPPPELIEAAGRVPVLRTGWVDLGCNWTAKE